MSIFENQLFNDLNLSKHSDNLIVIIQTEQAFIGSKMARKSRGVIITYLIKGWGD